VETALSVLVGIGLSAAAGFRVFVPLLVLSLAQRSGHLEVTAGFAWVGSDAALITFAVATVAEILGYYVPWVDHALDVVATPAALVAGVVLTASVVTDLDPFLRWTLAVLAGGGAAAAFQGLTAGARGISTLATGGLGNPVVSTAEAGVSAGLALLAVAVPIAAFVAVVALLYFAARRLLFRRRRTA
jgi:Domain of unknown function (DUF4126)